MLTARPASVWKTRYEISGDDRPLTTWVRARWKLGGHFELAGQRYDVRANMWGSKYGLVDPVGVPVAAANGVGRRRWSVEANAQTYEFRRTSVWRHVEELHAEGHRVGSMRRVSRWRRDAVAELPGLSLPVQVFVLAVALTKWDSADAASAAAMYRTGPTEVNTW